MHTIDESETQGPACDVNEELDMPDVPYLCQRSVNFKTDNAANISKAISDSSMKHIRCFAHTLNLPVQKFVIGIDGHLSKLRLIIKHFHNSPPSASTL